MPLHGDCIQVHSLRLTAGDDTLAYQSYVFRVPFVCFQFGLLDTPFSKMDLTASLSRSSYHTSLVNALASPCQPGGGPVRLTMRIAIPSLSLSCSFYRKGRVRAPFLPGGIIECNIAVASQVQCKKPQ